MEQKNILERSGRPEPGNTQTQSKSKTVITILATALLVLAGTGAWYWQYQKTNKLATDNENLTAQLADAREDETAKMATGDKSKNETVYRAKIGKFTLALPSKYVVIERVDGGGEGGNSTSLLIGDDTSSEGVAASYIYTEISMQALELGPQGTTFREYVDGALSEENPTKLPSVKIDGVTAEVYQVAGLASPRVVYFSKGDIAYKISLMDDQSKSSIEKLDAIVAGFKFD